MTISSNLRDSKTNILIAGIGGVGGYFGGLLAKHFTGNDHVAVNFLARGEHLNKIKQQGLIVIKGEEEFVALPAIASNDAEDFGKVDYIIIATKSYDLEAMLEQIEICVNENTILLPLLNGVDSRERIQKVFPKNVVLDGCAYIIARLREPGVVENRGNIQTLYFGLDSLSDKRLDLLESLFKEAGIEAFHSDTISKVLWEKFIFISPTATATSYFDKCIGEVLADEQMLAITTQLIKEVIEVAKAKGIVVSENILEMTLNKLKSMPFQATSSMHSDFQNNKPKNELSALTGYVLLAAQKYKIETPTYDRLYLELLKRNS